MMKRLHVLPLVLLIAAQVAAQPAWKQKADFPGDPRSSCSSFSFSDYGFIGLGYDGEDFRRSFYAYDPVYNSWIGVSSMGGVTGEGLERNVAAYFTIGTKGYAGTGQGGVSYLGDFWEYNYLTDVWTKKADFGGSTRRSALGFAVNGNGYIALGQDDEGFKNDLWEYDTTANTWTQKADFPGSARRLAMGFVIGGLAYVGTGDDGGFRNDFYVYEEPTNTWFVRDDFPGSPRYSATGFALNGKGYLACGYDTTLVNKSDFWEYDPIADTWTQMPDFPGGPRANAVAYVVDTLAFFGMGYNADFYADIWLWGDTSEIIQPDTTDTTISIIDIPLIEKNISIFPNPVYDHAQIVLDGYWSFDKTNINVFDMQGNNMTAYCNFSNGEADNRQTTIRFDQHDLPAGTYIITLRSGDYHAVQKFIVFEE